MSGADFRNVVVAREKGEDGEDEDEDEDENEEDEDEDEDESEGEWVVDLRSMRCVRLKGGRVVEGDMVGRDENGEEGERGI